MVNNHWLVVSNMNGLFFHHIWDVILPIDELIFFRGVGIPPTSICFLRTSKIKIMQQFQELFSKKFRSDYPLVNKHSY